MTESEIKYEFLFRKLLQSYFILQSSLRTRDPRTGLRRSAILNNSLVRVRSGPRALKVSWSARINFSVRGSLLQAIYSRHSTKMCHILYFGRTSKMFHIFLFAKVKSIYSSLEMVFLLWIWSILGSDIFRKWVLNSIVFFLMTKKSFKTQYLFMFVLSFKFVIKVCKVFHDECSLRVTKHSRMMILHVETSIFYNVRLLWTLEYFLPIS